MKLLKLAALALVLTSCSAIPPSPKEVATIGYGQPLPENYKELVQGSVQGYLNTHLKDPFSAVVTWKYPPVEGWVRTAPVQGSQLTMGWKVVCLVNAKNGFGGYVGNVPYLFMIRDGSIVFEVSGEDELNTALLDAYR